MMGIKSSSADEVFVFYTEQLLRHSIYRDEDGAMNYVLEMSKTIF